MTVRHTVERYLQDGDDRQTQRSWHFSADGGHITLRRVADGEHLMIFRTSDVDQFCADLWTLRNLAALEDV